jgi:hypothetical protein
MTDTDTDTRIEMPRQSTGTLTELFMGVLWIATSMYTAHLTLKGKTGDLSGVIGDAAAALPGLVAATLFTGAALGAAAASRFRSPLARVAAGVGVGVLFGLVAAAGIRFGYGSPSSITVLASTVGAASVLGGAIAAILPGDIIEAGLWGTTWVFFAGVILGVLQPNVVGLLGGGADASAAAQAAANTRFVWGQSILTGLFGAFQASIKLRNEKRSVPWFLVGGAIPGLILLGAEGLMRYGGESVKRLAKSFSPDEPVLVQTSDAARIRHGLVVLVVGAVFAAILGLRVKGRGEDDD